MKADPARVLDAAAARELAARGGRTLVFTNGVFDLLHAGHLQLLQGCAELADVLVVGVNEDAAVRRLKGTARPIQSLDERVAALAAVRWVDVVIPFAEPTASELIKALRPNTYAKGVEYDPAGPRPRSLPELVAARSVGARCRFIGMRPGQSTTELAGRIEALRPGSP